MPITIGSNLLAVNTLRQLGRSSSAYNRALERLSSGVRINRASDDPAGLSVSSLLNADSRVLQRGKLNLGDGVSMLNIADGALDSVSNTLIRMRELAASAANGTLGRAQRGALQSEYDALDKEIRRISSTATFNGQKLLTGTAQTTNYQAAPDIGSDNDPSISENGRYIFYEEEFEQFGYVLDTQTGQQVKVADYSLSGMTRVNTPVAVSNDGDVYLIGTVGTTSNLYKFSRASGTLAPLTQCFAGTDMGFTGLSADGTQVVFLSETYFADGGTATQAGATSGANLRLHVLNLETGRIRQLQYDLAVLDGARTSTAFSPDGRYLAFTSIANPLGTNADGNREVFLFDTTRTRGDLVQITQTAGGAGSAFDVDAVLNSGEVFFDSALNLTGENSLSYRQFFKAGPTGNNLTQLTHFNSSPSVIGMSTDGSLVNYTSTQNVTGENPIGYNQIFQLDLSTGETQQLSQFDSSSPVEAGSHSLIVSRSGRGFILSNTGAPGDIMYYGSTSIGDRSLNLQAGYGVQGSIAVALSDLRATLTNLGFGLVSSQAGARSTLDELDGALDAVSALRGKIGAIGSRVEKAMSVLETQSTEYLSARSRILDADIAQEVTNSTREQILTQLGSSILAQANQQPALALLLLRGR